MDISYDIFDIADFPILLTDKNFIITHKNALAAKLFPKLRKRSKISRHFRNFKDDIDSSDINELDIETGTQFMRALVFPISENLFLFLFFPLYAFTDTKNLLEHIRENFSGNLLDFYCAAYREYKLINSARPFEKANVSERAYSELIYLVSAFSEKPNFMQEEVYNVTEITSSIVRKTASLLAAFGLNISCKESEEKPCFSKINLRYFAFAIFRLIYIAFKLSRTGKIQISVDNSDYFLTDICVYTETAIPSEFIDTSNFYSLIALLPEFSFELAILKKMDLLNNVFSFSIKNSVLKLHYHLKRESGFNFVVRSESPMLRKKRINKVISETLSKIKILLSKN